MNRYLSRLEKLLSPLMLSQFFTTSVVLCTTAFQLVQSSTNGIKLVSMSAFLFGEMMQLGMYCFFADRIKEQQCNVGLSVYCGQWIASPGYVKSSVSIIMIRSGKDARLTVGSFVELSLNTFAGVLKSSYTYFALLRELGD